MLRQSIRCRCQWRDLSSTESRLLSVLRADTDSTPANIDLARTSFWSLIIWRTLAVILSMGIAHFVGWIHLFLSPEKQGPDFDKNATSLSPLPLCWVGLFARRWEPKITMDAFASLPESALWKNNIHLQWLVCLH